MHRLYCRRTGSGPSSLSVPDLRHLLGAGNLLDVGDSLEHVVQVNLGSVIPGSTLPERKRVDQDDIRGTNDSITSSIRELVPGVGGADLDGARDLALDSYNLGLELLAREVAAVEGLGADSDGVDLVGVGLSDTDDGVEVVVEGLLNIGPICRLLAIAPTS